MKVVVQRVSKAKVVVEEKIVGKIGEGYVLLVGFTHDDTIEDIKYCARKVANLRVFTDENDKLNKSIKDINGEILSISQFTLYGDARKGNRPSFINAARPEIATEYYNTFNDILKDEYNINVETGIFGAHMKVDLINDGPVTIIIES